MILRIQNKQGRGPWMPGLSAKWVDSFRTAQHPPIYDERPDYLDHVANAHKRGMHIGCAVRGREGLLSWFSPMEIFRLYDLGFYIADASACDVLIETGTQLVIASPQPLRALPHAVEVAA